MYLYPVLLSSNCPSPLKWVSRSAAISMLYRFSSLAIMAVLLGVVMDDLRMESSKVSQVRIFQVAKFRELLSDFLLLLLLPLLATANQFVRIGASTF